ncbi:NUDIX domain-containing protein [Candidatus Woesearchaeota archaeon]|nr:NUDIX domain-containing protein [Candidatus Woesearchaeota archaeon]
MREKSAGAVIYRKEDGKVNYLILFYGAGHWDYVKGNVEPDEEEEETVLREAEEEAGLMDLKLIRGFKERISYFYKSEGKTISKEVVFYLGETGRKEVKLSAEHKGYKWLELDKAVKQVTYKNSRNVLSKADKFIKSREGQ